MSYPQDPILKRIIEDLIGRYSENIIAIYGIGSYFDDSLPPNWVKNDIDIIVMVKTLEKIPTPDWTDIPYRKKQVDGHQVWIGFNTIQAYQDRDSFSKESFSNYEWSLIELKHPENSKLLYGKDIRDQFPSTHDLSFDYNDILARSLYHLDKSLSSIETPDKMKAFSKAVFKAAFYFCIFFDKSYRRTSIVEIGSKTKALASNYDFLNDVNEFFEEALLFRITGQYKTNFDDLQRKFIVYVFSLIESGKLHKRMNYDDILVYLTKHFGGFPNLFQKIKNLDLFKKS